MDIAMTGEVDRTRPHAELDGTDIDMRLSRYRELCVNPMSYLKHPLADEGSYFAVTNAQTGLATAAAPTAFSATNPFLLIYNSGRPGDDFAPRYSIDAISLIATAAGTGGTNVQMAITKDFGNRYTSGGTDLTPNIVNTGPTSTVPTARIFAGNITATAASSNAKTIIGNRFLKGAIPIAGDMYAMRFGSPSLPDMISISTILYSINNLPPIVLGPDESLLVHLWLTAQSAASSFLPEVSWYER